MTTPAYFDRPPAPPSSLAACAPLFELMRDDDGAPALPRIKRPADREASRSPANAASERDPAAAFDASALGFASSLAHDLRAPLAAVNLFLAVVKERYGDAFDERTIAHLHRAENVVERTGAMVQEHLDRYRARSTARNEPVDMTKIAADVRDSLEAEIEETGASVRVGTLPVVTGNPTELHQLLQNLVSNAISHAGREKPAICVQAELVDNAWVFGVSDNGQGFAAEEAEQLFERSYRGNGSSGYGLGLALCREIAERHDGRIWARSNPGHGSTFFFSLPASGHSSRANQSDT